MPQTGVLRIRAKLHLLSVSNRQLCVTKRPLKPAIDNLKPNYQPLRTIVVYLTWKNEATKVDTKMSEI